MGNRQALRHRWRRALWWAACGVALLMLGITLWHDIAGDSFDADPAAPGGTEYANDALLVVAALLCGRAAVRGVVLRPSGVAVVGFLRTRRVAWEDIAEVELALRTGGSHSGRWRIALRLHDGTARWIPSFLHGSMDKGKEEVIPPGDHTRYGEVFHEAPAHAPRELARLHRELRLAWHTHARRAD
ncbi:PH domain-containing protein [Yinghuangia sp. ASG 101]|uniref:PH domain-containing protein n=1 Tax=Yinghuangia sp. ASG 101 TaxID=2896848 RepID=UPI001E2ADCF7|nr:PH domain-containing protein [Yinghuangia sp. ASG 101]UGQ11724.1 PH domain-containing protein [Yinghuangia sp. ASG 101]